jgi:hypothetical protein
VCRSVTRSAATHPSHLVDGGLRVAGGGVAGGDRLVEVRLLGLQDQKGNQQPKGNMVQGKCRSAPAAEAAVVGLPWWRGHSLSFLLYTPPWLTSGGVVGVQRMNSSTNGMPRVIRIGKRVAPGRQ